MLIAGEPDRARIAARLPQVRSRAERIRHSADSLRWAVQDRARQFARDDLDVLGREIEMEAGALRHWTTEEPRPGQAAEPPSLGTAPRMESYAWQKSARPENTA